MKAISLVLLFLCACGSTQPLPKGPPPEYEEEPAQQGGAVPDAGAPQ